MKYKILDHISDLKIKVLGKNLPELFENAVLAIRECLRPEIEIPEKNTKSKIKIKSADLSSLLVDFLSEVLYQTQVNKEIYYKVKFDKFSDTELETELFGKKVRRFGLEIKGVTYHNLEIKKIKNHWQATIVFDI
mgnify:CR=1 FL=1